MVAKLKLIGIEGRTLPGMEPISVTVKSDNFPISIIIPVSFSQSHIYTYTAIFYGGIPS